MSDKLISVMSEMVTKVCEQDKEIARLKAALEQKQEEVEALHDVWWQAYNCFPAEGWEDVQVHLINSKGTIDIEEAKACSKRLKKKPELFEDLPVAEKEALKRELRRLKEEIASWIKIDYSTVQGAEFMLGLLNAEQASAYYAWQKARKATASEPVAPPESS